MRREPAVPAAIAGLNAAIPRVRVVGRIISLDSQAGVAILDDGVASTTLIFRSDEIRKVKEGAVVRVFGRPVGEEIAAELVQDMGALDLGLFKRVISLEVKNED